MKKFVTAFAAAAVLVGAMGVAPAQAAESITGIGASYPLIRVNACIASFPASLGTVTYTGPGSGSGQTAMTNGTHDFGWTDVTYTNFKPETMTYVPLTSGPIAFVYNIPGVTRLNVSASVMSKIFTGKILKWDDAAIKALNPAAKLPNQPITIVYRGSSSGTTGNMINWLMQNNPADGWVYNTTFTTANPTKSFLGVSASNGPDLATKVARTKYSIGYVDLADSATKALKTAFLENKYMSGTKPVTQYLQPSAAAAGLFLAGQTMLDDGSTKIDHTKTVKNGYAASLISFMIAPKGSTTAKGATVEAFANHVLNTCKTTPGFTVFPAATKAKIQKLVDSISTK